MKRKTKAFTLIELLVVISIIIILVAILIPAVNAAIKSATLAKGRAYLNSIAEACDAFKQDFHAYPGQRDLPDVTITQNRKRMGRLLYQSLVNPTKKRDYMDYSKDGEVNGCFSDKFSGAEMPILYFPSKRGNRGDSAANAFDVNANTQLVNLKDVAGYSQNTPASQNRLPSASGDTYIWDKTGKVRNYDTFLLIAPGGDRKYFHDKITEDSDDITNFRG